MCAQLKVEDELLPSRDVQANVPKCMLSSVPNIFLQNTALNVATIYIIIIIILLYLSAHVQRTKQALGIAPHEALFKKKKHTQKVY